MLLFPDLPSLKLVEPGRDEGVVRVETMVRVSGVLGSGSGYRVPVVVSTQPFASLTCWLNQLQKRRALTCWLNQLREMNTRAGSAGFEELGFGSVHHHFHHSSVGFGTGGPVRARGEDQLRASPNERRGPDRCVGSGSQAGNGVVRSSKEQSSWWGPSTQSAASRRSSKRLRKSGCDLGFSDVSPMIRKELRRAFSQVALSPVWPRGKPREKQEAYVSRKAFSNWSDAAGDRTMAAVRSPRSPWKFFAFALIRVARSPGRGIRIPDRAP